MTRENKLKREKQIESYFYLFIVHEGAWDYWLEPHMFEQISRSANCSVHLVKKIFFKKMLPNENFKTWLENFEY